MVKTPTKKVNTTICSSSASVVSPIKSSPKKKISFGGGACRVKTPVKSKTQKIDLCATKAQEIAIAVMSKPSKNTLVSSFIHPMRIAFNSEDKGDELAQQWSVLMMPPRRGADGTTTMKTPPAYKWDWNCAVIVINEDKSLPQMGRHLAKCFTKFTSDPKSGLKEPETYEFRTAFE